MVLQTPTNHASAVQSEPVPRAAPTFFLGLLYAFPLTTAMWIAVFLTIRADL